MYGRRVNRRTCRAAISLRTSFVDRDRERLERRSSIRNSGATGLASLAGAESRACEGHYAVVGALVAERDQIGLHLHSSSSWSML